MPQILTTKPFDGAIDYDNVDKLFETDHYVVAIGKSQHTQSAKDVLLYQIVNRRTGVVEVELSTLYRAIFMVKELEVGLVEAVKYDPNDARMGTAAAMAGGSQPR